MRITPGSKEWLEWRRQGIGGSDAPIIMGVGSMSIEALWEIKTGRSPGPDLSGISAVQRGVALEPKARALYELENETEMPAALFVHEDKPFLRVSLDGYGRIGTKLIVLEIKCPGPTSKTTELAQQGKIDPKYIPQLAHQQMVTGADEVHFYVFDGEKGITIPYVAEPAYLSKLLAAEEAFWECVVKDVRPEPKLKEPTSEEVKKLFTEAAALEMDLKNNPDPREARLSELKELIKEKVKTNCTFAGLNLIWSDRTTIDTKRIIADYKIDVSNYSTTTKTATISRKRGTQ